LSLEKVLKKLKSSGVSKAAKLEKISSGTQLRRLVDDELVNRARIRREAESEPFRNFSLNIREY
jgi:hypothetical protein